MAQSALVALAVVFMVFPLAFVLLRFWARSLSRVKYGVDDWLIVPAVLLIMGMCISQLLGAIQGNLGIHDTVLDPQPSEAPSVVHKKTFYVLNLLYPLCNGSTKLSLLFLYRRIFVPFGRSFNATSVLFVVITILWMLAFFLGSIFTCSPVSAFWTLPLSPTTSCLPIAFFDTLSVTDIVTAIMVLALPVPAILSRTMSVEKRIASSALFLLGVFVVVAGAIRLCYFLIQGESAIEGPDSSYYASPLVYWAVIQCSLGIVCACVPAFSPVFKRPQREETDTPSSIRPVGRTRDPTAPTTASETARASENTASDKTKRASYASSGSVVWPLPPTSQPANQVHNLLTPSKVWPHDALQAAKPTPPPKNSPVIPVRSFSQREYRSNPSSAVPRPSAFPARSDSRKAADGYPPVTAAPQRTPTHPLRSDSRSAPPMSEALGRPHGLRSNLPPIPEPPPLRASTAVPDHRPGRIPGQGSHRRTPTLRINGQEIPVTRDSRGEGLGTFYSHDENSEEDVARRQEGRWRR